MDFILFDRYDFSYFIVNHSIKKRKEIITYLTIFMTRKKKQSKKLHVHSCGCYYDDSYGRWVLCDVAKRLRKDWKSWSDMEKYWNHFKELDK